MKRTVKLIAVDKRYKESSYPFRPVYSERLGTYKTGQHIDPAIPETSGNLTLDEMTGEVKLSEDKRKRFPYVIKPEVQINFVNGQEFDLTKEKDGTPVNPKDVALFNLLREEAWFVSPSKDKLIPRKHYFYIKDDLFEAEQRVKKSDMAYRAEKFIREEMTPEGLRDIALVLSYKLKDFNYKAEKFTDIMLKDRLLELCKSKPEKILECKESGTSDDIYVLKLALHGIIKRRGNDFYTDTGSLIGTDLEQVKKYMRMDDNTMTVSKWNRLLADIEGRLPQQPKEDPQHTSDESPNSKKENLYEEIKDKDIAELRKFAGSKRYPKSEWSEITSESQMIKYLLGKVK